MDAQSNDTLPIKTIEKVIRELKARARESHKAARTYFYMIIVVIVVGLIVFIFANRFSSPSFEVEKALSQAKLFLHDELRTRAPFADSLSRLLFLKEKYFDSASYIFDQHFRKFRSSSTGTENDSTFYRVSSLYGNLSKKLNDSRLTQDVEARYETYFASNEQLSSKYFDKAREDILRTLQSSNYELYTLINTTTLRIGSVVIILFLVQLLVRVFRYNTRLSNFYAARAHALELYGRDGAELKLKDLVLSLSSDALDMGVSKTPSDQMMELARLLSQK